MGRRLPWAQKTDSVTTNAFSTTNVHTPRAQRNWDSSRRSPGIALDQPLATEPPGSNAQRRQATSRTPSTSPPPGPPPISPLRPGYDNDDLYVMVEDEFWSVAQSYTAHLHHAEYKRLMSKAKEAPPREIADLSPSKPKDARDRVRVADLRERQDSALDQITGRSVLAVQSTSSDNDEDGSRVVTQKQKKERKQRAPRQGTGLATLMGNNEQVKTSLVGLERLPSATRAAKGYSKGNTGNSQTTVSDRGNQDVMDLLSGTGRRGLNGYIDTINIDQHTALEDDEEDIWGRERKLERKKLRFEAAGTGTTKDFKQSGREGRSMQVAGNISSSKKDNSRRNYMDGLEDGLHDDDDDDDMLAPKTVPSRNVKSGTTKQSKDEKKDRRSRLDEVPLFMF